MKKIIGGIVQWAHHNVEDIDVTVIDCDDVPEEKTEVLFPNGDTDECYIYSGEIGQYDPTYIAEFSSPKPGQKVIWKGNVWILKEMNLGGKCTIEHYGSNVDVFAEDGSYEGRAKVSSITLNNIDVSELCTEK